MNDGDDFICGVENGLWKIHQHIILTWGVYTMFRWDKLNLLERKTEYINWFVPRDADQCYEICKWLEQELDHHVRDPMPATEIHPEWPGCEVQISVMEFSGVEPYTEQAEIKKLAENLMKQMLSRFNRMEEKDDIDVEKDHGESS